VKNKLEKVSSAGQMLRCLARVPGIVECGRSALRHTQEAKLTELRDETRDLYNASIIILRDLHGSYLAAARNSLLYANFQRLYGLALFTTGLINCLLRSLSSELERDSLKVEAAHFASEVIVLAEEAAIFRPLGSSYMMLCLPIAWISTTDIATKRLVEKHWKDYASDFPTTKVSQLELESTSRQFSLVEHLNEEDIDP
jgi:hypothetical protein